MKEIIILGISILLVLTIFTAGCIFEEKKTKKKPGEEPGNGNNGISPDNITEMINITELYHEPTNPTVNDEITFYAKIKSENELASVTIFFCVGEICTLAEQMTLKTGTQDTYEHTLQAGTYDQGTEVKYNVIATDNEGNSEEAENSFIVQ